MIALDPFYPIVPDSTWLARLLPEGIKLVQLRIKDRTEETIRSEIQTALALCQAHGCQLVVNDYWRAAIDLGANFVHLGQEDLANADLAAIRAAGLRLGVSTHSEAELQIALDARPDYVALGPIYPTLLKKMPWAPQGLERIKVWKARIACPLVAIGGITPERAKAVLSAGADSLAVITDIVTHEDPAQRTRYWVADTRQASNIPTASPQERFRQ